MRQKNQLRFGEEESLIALRTAWSRALEDLERQINKPLFESCLSTVTPIAMEGENAVLSATSEFAKYWIENKYLSTIQQALSAHLGLPVRVSVRLVQDQSQQGPLDNLEAPEPRIERKPGKGELEFVLNEHFTFDNFVVGASNRMAFAASQAVAKSPGASYNPLFIYGGPGLGKTHLLQAIGHFVRKYHPDMGIQYTSAETFTCDYVAAVSDRKTAQFRRRYRNIDVWLVDDIQFLAGKERTKEEFFHTFNSLHEVGRQIVLTSDKPPKELELDLRLSSRFEAGLVVDVAPPDLETRMAIIQSKAQKRDMTIPNDVVLYMARLIRSNIRAIEGALLRIHAYAAMMHEPVSTDMATDILARYFEEPKENIITPDTVQEVVARHFRVDVKTLNSPSRQSDVVMARQVAMYLIRQLTQSSLPTIGKAFGGKDHSTVLHAINKISKLVLQNSQVADDISALSRELQSGN
ncbi:MAG: chromosomal replication initiator protein DnaA [Armatimonadetes bacterium]|nr:chromosomal replication initiator protein DnaA [Armatimonadota bacterium]